MRENNSNYKSQSLRFLSLVSLAFALFYNPYPTSAKKFCRQIPYQFCYQNWNTKTQKYEIRCEIRYAERCTGDPKI